MSAPFVPALDTFAGGQMTDLPSFTGAVFDGTELFEIVSGTPSSPTTAANAVNYSITSLMLASLLVSVPGSTVFITQGQNTTAETAYVVGQNVTRVYIYKPTPEPTFITLGNASSQNSEPLIKDVAGTATSAGGNFITVDFTGGQLADGLSSVPISQPYGGFFFRKVVNAAIPLAQWTLGQA
jgi:hypothetical protein